MFSHTYIPHTPHTPLTHHTPHTPPTPHVSPGTCTHIIHRISMFTHTSTCTTHTLCIYLTNLVHPPTPQSLYSSVNTSTILSLYCQGELSREIEVPLVSHMLNPRTCTCILHMYTLQYCTMYMYMHVHVGGVLKYVHNKGNE